MSTADILFGKIEDIGVPFAAKFDNDQTLYRGYLTRTRSGHLQVIRTTPYLPWELARRVYEAYEGMIVNKIAAKKETVQ